MAHVMLFQAVFPIKQFAANITHENRFGTGFIARKVRFYMDIQACFAGIFINANMTGKRFFIHMHSFYVTVQKLKIVFLFSVKLFFIKLIGKHF